MIVSIETDDQGDMLAGEVWKSIVVFNGNITLSACDVWDSLRPEIDFDEGELGQQGHGSSRNSLK